MIFVTDLIFSESKRGLDKEAKSTEFLCSAERPSRGISKPYYVKEIPLFPRNLKLNYPRNKLIPCKLSLLSKTQPKLFQICTNLICVIDLIFSESKKHFKKKARSKEFPYFSESQGQAFQNQTMLKESLYCQKIWKWTTREINYFHTNVLFCGRPNQNSFKFTQIKPTDKKPFSNQITSRE